MIFCSCDEKTKYESHDEGLTINKHKRDKRM